MKRRIEKLIFIYDADSGKAGAIVDSVKKVLRLKGCALCAITHGVAGEKQEWKSCQEDLGVPVDYWHRDEVPPMARTRIGNELPCVAAQVDGETLVLIGPDVIERCKGSVADLKGRLRYYAGARNLELPETG
ncbi:MAG TPA: hypothetical protein VJH03_27050 [Blastocatellia bacterium]|nr:hypothetical protein [Blastocatellia bacterium]